MKFISLFLLLSTFCFAMTPECENNRSQIRELISHNRFDACIHICSWYLGDPNTSNVDKIHYLWNRQNIYMIAHDICSYLQDWKSIEELINTYPECREEMEAYYRH